ncbi:hypothetical protein CLV56_3658 [Mumia flava]|uniref:Uncharacterized protein n=1 Tax=Mumia flava TaxID=1348852 RepID=A0A2M9B893_9ACTN|nr:DUF6069 family protein [Mumia flava]PJJ54154.1 hypothetical protein CLV56_3658 [Mumia flava]
MSYDQPPYEPGDARPSDGGPQTPSGLTIDPGRLWAGGVATAVVAGLAAVVGLLVCRGVFDIPVFVPDSAGGWDVASTVPYAFGAAAAALLATALMHLLLIATPRPKLFFGWIATLITVIVGVLPFTVDIDVSEQIASAAVGVLIAIVIATLVSGTASRSVKTGVA